MPKDHRFLPVALFALLAGLLVGSWRLVLSRERAALQSRLDTTTSQVSARLEEFLDNHIERVKLLGNELLLRAPIDESEFRLASAAHQRDHVGLQALNWVRPDGVIQWVEPQQGNLDALGFDLSEHPVASEAFLSARERRDVATTPPLELLQGGWGFASYYPLDVDGEVQGYLNVVFRLPELLESCLAGTDSGDLAYLLRFGDDLLGTHGPSLDESLGLPVSSATVDIAGRELTLTVLAPPTLLAARATWVDEALLVAGVVLAGALALLVRVAQRRRTLAETSSARYRVLLENAPDAIFAIDRETGEFISGNTRAYELFGLGPEELLGMTPDALSPAPQAGGRSSGELFEEHLARIHNGGSPVFEWRLQRRNGDAVLTEVHLVGMPNPGRDLVRASVLDITRRHELEHQLRRAQAHDAMGRLAGSVAHDFNNLLTAILGSSELLRDQVASNSNSTLLVDEVTSACHRAANLTHQLLAFSRHSSLSPEVLSLNDVVAGILPILRRLVGERVRVVVELESRQFVRADPSQLELALVNLVVNARDAMPTGGDVAIKTTDLDSERVALIVQDEGEGIPEEDWNRVFEPFYTTKNPSVGTGIGLATVREIVKQAAGEIEVVSTPGKGTTFRAVFAAHPSSPEAKTASSRKAVRAAGGERVLVVEDNSAVRGVLRRSLESAGYDVIEAESAEEALDLARRGEVFDVLLTDVVLPKMRGDELVAQLRLSKPELPALLVSGYSEAELAFGGPSDRDRTAVLAKPFPPHQLVEELQALLRLELEA